MTAFAQAVPARAGSLEVFPGQANWWVLDRDFALAQGFGLQFSSALELFTGALAAPAARVGLRRAAGGLPAEVELSFEVRSGGGCA